MNNRNSLIADKEDLYEIKKSKFYAFSYAVKDLNEIQAILKKIKYLYLDAKHICYAYIVNEKEVIKQKYSDDGEPQGTAGLPLLNLLKKYQLENVIVIVVRYFGGIKLGASNLLRAYLESAKLVLNNNIRPLTYFYVYEFIFTYKQLKEIDYFLYKIEAVKLKQEFYDTKISYLIQIKTPLDLEQIKGWDVKKINEGWV